MTRRFPLFVLIIAALLSASNSHALVSTIGLSALHPAQFPDKSFTVAGLRMSLLWGQHRKVYGIDLSPVGNVTTEKFAGLAISGIFNWTQISMTGIGAQLAGVVNVNKSKGSIYGLQLAGGMNLNSNELTVTGLQASLLANYCPQSVIHGAQISVINKAHEIRGIQIGLINQTDYLRGVQIGLLNFNEDGPVAIAPILNIGF
jgi:hypothetical protein